VILMSAIQKGASDIHIEPYEKELRVRYRIDGILYNIMQPPMKFRDAITSRIKIMSKLDIAEKRLPQDGRIKIRFQDGGESQDIDFRVSCLPTLFGEKIVHASPDKDEADARHDQARVRERVARQVRARDREAVGHGARDRARPAR
jgi:type IV pilus assembly protein PilB